MARRSTNELSNTYAEIILAISAISDGLPEGGYRSEEGFEGFLSEEARLLSRAIRAVAMACDAGRGRIVSRSIGK